MPNCCQGASCACKITPLDGGHIAITGSGSANDPFVVSADVALAVADNPQFDLTLSGVGTADSPWIIAVGYATTAKLSNVPDVNASAPTNGQVLAWNSSTSKWEAAASTTAAAGSVSHNTSLSGDGSVGTPLAVVPNAARLLGSTASGVGLSDAGMAAAVQHFATTSARSSMSPAPVLNQLTMVDTSPGRIDYWDGSAWKMFAGTAQKPLSGAIAEFSGPYVAGMPLTHIMKHVIVTTASGGGFEALSTTDLAGFAGVMSVMFTQVGLSGSSLTFQGGAGIGGFAGTIRGIAYLTSTGAALGSGASVNVLVEAWAY